MPNEDPWSRSLLSPSPSLSDCDPIDKSALHGFLAHETTDDNLLDELDLSKRDDVAIVKETPFTLAKLRPKSSIKQGVKSRTRPVRGNLATAGQVANPEHSKPPPLPQQPKPDWKNSSGWVGANGQPIPHCPPSKKTEHIPTVGVTTTTIAAFQEKSAKNGPKSKGRAKRNERTKTKEDTKIQFHSLPGNIKPTAEFPIVAALERQKALPTKASRKRLQNKQSQADVEALIQETSQRAVKKVKRDNVKSLLSFRSSSPTSVTAGLQPLAVMDKATVFTSPHSTQLFNKSDNEHTDPALDEPTDHDHNVHGTDGLPERMNSSTPPDAQLATPPQSTIANRPPDPEVEMDVDSCPSQFASLVRPKPIRPPTVPRLEAMVAGGTMNHANIVPERPSRYLPHGNDDQSKGHGTVDHPEPTSAAMAWRSSYQTPHRPDPQPHNTVEYKYGLVSPEPSPHVHTYAPVHAVPSLTTAYSYNPDGSQAFAPRHWQSIVKKTTTDAEWSTFPTRKRLTLRPAAPTTSSSFRMPTKLFTPQQTPRPRPSMAQGPSTSQGVKLTLWSPTPLSHDNGTQQAKQSYTPHHLRLLQNAAGSPTNGRARAYSPQPEPESQLEPESEDWVAAWSRSANVASRRNTCK